MSNTTTVNLDALDETIVRYHEYLVGVDEGTSEYTTALDQLTKLYDLRRKMTPEAPPAPEPTVDKDRTRFKDWLPIIGSVGGILVIVAFEAAGHGVTSKALGFVRK